MKKIRLNLDDLQVDSFETTEPDSTRPGTVFGMASDPTVCGWGTCGNTDCNVLTCNPTSANDTCVSTQDFQCGTGDNTQYTDGSCSCTGDGQSIYCVSLAAGSLDICDTVNNLTCYNYFTCGGSGC
ncbi:MAG TPA: hypothetical protein VHB25_16400 [Gemmatimonadaceae bacterium]|nr:hypothetical protein [Gemmatimonadaceae bacterium]